MRRLILTILVVLLFTAVCCQQVPEKPEALPTTAEVHHQLPEGADSIILFIVDGMGPEALSLLDAYLQATEKSPNRFEELYDKGVIGLATTYGADNVTNDSASTATALSSGVKTFPLREAMDPEGRCTTTILDLAEQRGWSTGLISTTRVSHATPAAFGACNESRYNEPQIVDDLLDRGVDVMLGGGINAWIPETARAKDYAEIDPALDSGGKRKDDVDRLSRARELGYTIVFDKNKLESLDGVPSGKLLGLFSGSVFPPSIDRLADDAQYDLPTLEEMTRAALDILEQDQEGSFLMVEAAQVDYAAHANDPGWYLSEMLEANRTLGLLLDFISSHPDTLLIVTADHATGGPALSYRAGMDSEGDGYVEFDEVCGKEINVLPNFVWPSFHDVRALGWQKHSYDWMIDNTINTVNDPSTLMLVVEQHTPYKLGYESAAKVLAYGDRTMDKCYPLESRERTLFYPYPQYRRSAQMAVELAPQTNIVWATGAHTHAPVLVGSIGPGSQRLAGWMDNTDIFLAMKAAMH